MSRMMLKALAASFAAFASFVNVAQASGTIAGVNHRYLPFLEAAERDAVINASVAANSSIIRIFIRGIEESRSVISGSTVIPKPDPETSLGQFDSSILDTYDDVLASVYKISGGLTKVIISPHDARALQAPEGSFCDAYCQAVNGNWEKFYTDPDLRSAYKVRLTYIFNTYKSKNFNSRPWSSLSQVILGVDVQNEPWAGVSPIPSGEDWLCDISSHLKDNVGLGKSNIAVVSGGISGSNSELGRENWPDIVFTCPAIAVVTIHSAFANVNDTYLALTPWAKMLARGMPLVSASLKYNKLLLIEEWSFKPSGTDISSKPADIWRTGELFILRGISFLYSSIISKPVEASSPADINILESADEARTRLEGAIRNTRFRGQSSDSFDWSPYITTGPSTTNYPLDTMMRLYPDKRCGPDGGQCLGNVCALYRPCASNTVCKNDICEPCTVGCADQACPCQRSNVCVNDTCVYCPGNFTDISCLNGACNANRRCLNAGFCMTGKCLDCTGDGCQKTPCKAQSDCSTGSYCDGGGLCQSCSEGVGCVGQTCAAGTDCKSGNCSSLGICEY